MRIDVLTLFPGPLQAYLSDSIVRRAQDKGLVSVCTVNIRDYAHDRHRTVDDKPYGGGPGMVMKPEPIFEALEAGNLRQAHKVCLSPRGRLLSQQRARELATLPHLVLLCGHYEGVDQRVLDAMDEELSIGDYVLSNGVVAAMVVIDAVVRLLPGALGNEESTVSESFSDGLLEYPQYTRPAEFRGRAVPEVLLKGNHAEIGRWRRAEAVARTETMRPDLYAQVAPAIEAEKQKTARAPRTRARRSHTSSSQDEP